MTGIDTKTLRWLLPYFAASRGLWIAAALATIVSSLTDPDCCRR